MINTEGDRVSAKSGDAAQVENWGRKTFKLMFMNQAAHAPTLN